MLVCLLGGFGYIGSHVVELLLNQGYKVKVLDYLVFKKDHMKDYMDRIDFYRGDIRDATDVAKAVCDSDAVVHLAGLVGDPACAIDEEKTWLCNNESSRIIADVCNHYNTKRFIFISSCSVYGASPSHVVLNEGSYLNPVSLYAKTKIDSEKIFLEMIEGDCAILRLATVFGYSRRMRFDLVVNKFTIEAVKEKKLQVFGGTQFRPFIHCQDVARAILTVLRSDSSKINRETFNVSVENINIRDLANLVATLVQNTEVEIVDKAEDDRNYRVSSEKISWLLGFNPTLSLKAGIKDLIDKIEKFKYNDWKSNKIYYNHKMNCLL